MLVLFFVDSETVQTQLNNTSLVSRRIVRAGMPKMQTRKLHNEMQVAGILIWTWSILQFDFLENHRRRRVWYR